MEGRFIILFVKQNVLERNECIYLFKTKFGLLKESIFPPVLELFMPNYSPRYNALEILNLSVQIPFAVTNFFTSCLTIAKQS